MVAVLERPRPETVIPLRALEASSTVPPTPITGDNVFEVFAEKFGTTPQELWRKSVSREVKGGLKLEDAEDAAQETFTQAWQHALEGRVDPKQNLKVWWNTTNTNKGIDIVRRKRGRNDDSKRRRIVPLDEEHDKTVIDSSDSIDPAVAAEEREQVLLVKAALASLPPGQRDVVEKLYFDGLTQTETAERLGIPLGTVKSRDRLARESLRKNPGLKDYWRSL